MPSGSLFIRVSYQPRLGLDGRGSPGNVVSVLFAVGVLEHTRPTLHKQEAWNRRGHDENTAWSRLQLLNADCKQPSGHHRTQVAHVHTITVPLDMLAAMQASRGSSSQSGPMVAPAVDNHSLHPYRPRYMDPVRLQDERDERTRTFRLAFLLLGVREFQPSPAGTLWVGRARENVRLEPGNCWGVAGGGDEPHDGEAKLRR